MGSEVTSDLSKIRDGDQVALQSWFQDHVDGLYGFIYYRVGNNSQAAEDVTQSTFERALERLDDFDSERGTMSAWLRLTSRNLIRDHLKVSLREVPLEDLWSRLDDALEKQFLEIDDRELPAEVLERSETRELVSMTLAVLPDHYREVLDAKYLDEQTLQAIADSRGATIDSIKSLLRRARAAFKQTFQTLSDPKIPS
jgi:RNA polymerase sigma-70 factor (ECF subfamily)